MQDSTNAQLQLLVDHFEIREAVEAYIHARDHADGEATADIYHPDSTEDHGPIQDSGRRFAERANEALLSYWTGCHHLLGQTRIKVTGDTAGAETYFLASLTRELDGVKMLDQMAGRYIDRFERREGKWRIKARKCVSSWSLSVPITSDFLRGHEFLQTQQSEQDPSYEVLGLKRGCSRIQR